ncbi:MAG: hypothetical protein Q9218_007471 [Villophora microphyllina]
MAAPIIQNREHWRRSIWAEDTLCEIYHTSSLIRQYYEGWFGLANPSWNLQDPIKLLKTAKTEDNRLSALYQKLDLDSKTLQSGDRDARIQLPEYKRKFFVDLEKRDRDNVRYEGKNDCENVFKEVREVAEEIETAKEVIVGQARAIRLFRLQREGR